VAAHRAHEREGRLEVVLVVLVRLHHALTDRLEPGKVDDGVNLRVREHRLGLVSIREREGVHGEGGPAERLHSSDGGGLGVGEAVDDDHLVASGKQLDDGVGADIAGTTGDKDAHALTVCRPARFA
jgi:hypothetical protein